MLSRAGRLAFFTILLALPGVVLVACKTTPQRRRTSYARSAAVRYKRAMVHLKADNYLQAIKSFNLVKARFPFSTYAALAELGIADTYFKQEKYLLAIDAYKLFGKLHPGHPKADYAAYMAAEASRKQIPSDWFLVPPPRERDLSSARHAAKNFRKFIASHPKSKLVPRARASLLKCRYLLADHELYVARFYRKRGKHAATVIRLAYLLKTYPDVALAVRASLELAEAYEKIGRRKAALQTLTTLLRKHAGHKLAERAKERLDELRAAPPPKASTKKKAGPSSRAAKPAGRPAPAGSKAKPAAPGRSKRSAPM